MDTSLDELKGVPKGWAHGAQAPPPRGKISKLLFYFTFFSYFQNKVAEIRGENNFFGKAIFKMKILGTFIDELAPTGENPWHRHCLR